MASEIKNFYEFGKFRFDMRRLALEHNGEAVQLPPKSLEMLKILLERQGEIVTRENLLEEIWAQSFVEDANLTVVVSTLRKTLSGYEGNKTFIQTVPRRGYRFVAEAHEKTEIVEPPIVVERRAVEHLMVEQNSPRLFSRVFAAVAILSLIALAGAVVFLSQHGKSFAANAGINPAANEAFIKGDALLQKRQACESISYFRETVANDGNFARGFSGLAAALAMCGDPRDDSEKAVARALALDPNSAEANATDGFIKMFRHWDWDRAEAALRRAVALDPNSATAHHWLGVCLSLRGRLYEARGEMGRAVEIEPESPLYHADLGQLHYFDHSYDAAVSEYDTAVALDPNFTFTPGYLRDVYLMRRNEKEAAKYEIQKSALFGKTPELLKQDKEIIEREGFKNYCQLVIESSIAQLNRGEVYSSARALYIYQIQDYYAVLKDKENTLHWLEQAVDCDDCIRPFWLPYIGVDPRYDFLRGDRRFQAVLQKMNLLAAKS